MKKRLWLTLSLFVIGALVLAACGGATPGPTPTPAKPKVVTITFTQEPDSLSPLYTSMWFSGITREFWLRGLWDFDDKGAAQVQLAAEIPSEANGGVTNGGKTIVWSDGTPLTAADFVFTYQMVISDKNKVSSTYPYKEQVESVEAKDDHTLVVNFKQPFAPWLTTIFTNAGSAGIPILPKHILQPVFDKDGTLDNAEWNRQPTVGVGPFVFKEWESGSHITFVRNDKWFGPAPKVDQIFIRITPEDAAQMAAIKSGDTDIGSFLSFSDKPDVESSGKAVFMTDLSGYDESWFLNVDPKTAHPAMLDPKVRLAIALATDRFKITKDLLYGATEPAGTFWDSTPPFGDPNIKPYPYDPEQAKKLLDEAGWKDTNGDGVREKDGKDLKLRYITNQRQLRKDVQAVVQQMWAGVGIGAELVNYSSDVYFNSFAQGGPQATGQYDIAEYSQAPSFPDPDSSTFLCSEIPSAEKPEGQNWMGYCNSQLDDLFKQQATATDQTARLQIFSQIEKIMYDDVIWIGMWKDPDCWSVNKRLTGVKFSGGTSFFNVTDWDITP